MAGTTPITGPDSRDALVIDAARANRAAITDLEIQRLQLAVEWVLLHPGEEVDTTAPWGMRDLEIAGDGAPTIDEGAIAEFSLAIGVSTDSGRLYLGDAVELKYRLPRIWKRVMDGRLPVWKARKIADATRSLPPEGAGFVDRALYFVAHKCSFAEIDRQVDKARAEFDPAEAERRRLEAAERRHVKVHLGSMTHDGQVPITAMADLGDALAFEEYVAAEAAKLDPAIPLQVRRSMVLGMLGGQHQGSGAQRELVIYTHTRPDQTVVDVDNTRTYITPEQLQDWCAQAGTKVTIKPVIDLNEELATDGYRPTAALKEQTRLRYPECPFPLCNRPSWRKGQHADHDHIVEYPEGPTASSNMAPPCPDTTGSRPSPPGPTGESPASAGSGPAPSDTDISADHDPADHGRRGGRHARRSVSKIRAGPPNFCTSRASTSPIFVATRCDGRLSGRMIAIR